MARSPRRWRDGCGDLLREADYFAALDNAPLVQEKHVDQAIEEKIYRVRMIEDKIQEMIEDGPVTATYKGDVDRSIAILNEALATEIVCVLRYMHHYFMATGVHGKAAADEFKEHADAEREHADDIAERIQQLGGKPDFNPRNLLERSASQYIEGETLADMIREDLVADERHSLLGEIHDRVAGGVAEQTTLAVQPLMEFRAGQGLQQADHRRDDAALLDEIDLPLKDGGRIAVEADDETRLHLHAVALNALHVFDQIAFEVLLLAAFGQAGFIGRLNADEDHGEPGGPHQGQQLFVIGHVDRGLGLEGDAGLILTPRDQRGQ